MTPFGARLRDLRKKRAVRLKDMAAALGVSPAYLSALEHGRRGRPGPGLVLQIAGYFGLIWDDVEELRRLARLSHPRIVVDTGGLIPKATLFANLLARHVAELDEAALDAMLREMGFDEEV
jgi:transcriptional regulator with XRE-family HTH domain